MDTSTTGDGTGSTITSSPALEFLLVTAEYTILKAVTAGLKEFKANIGCMTTMDSALDYVGRRKIDGIFLDLQVESMLDLIAAIREGTSNRFAVIFACAGDRLESKAAQQAGANVLLHKPLVVENISTSVAASRELMMRERRRYFRHPVSMAVSLTANHKQQRAMMVNIGEGGMAVFGVTLECSSLVDFSFQLPVGPILSGRGQIAWTNRQGLMGIGFQFLRGTGKYDLLTWLSNREQIMPQPKP
jgi:CheY-like chemotaxis protein